MDSLNTHTVTLLKNYLLSIVFLWAVVLLLLHLFLDQSAAAAFFLSVDLVTLTGFFTSLTHLSYNEIFSWVFLVLLEVVAFVHLYFICRFVQLRFQPNEKEFDVGFDKKLMKELLWYFLIFQSLIFFLIFYSVTGNVSFDSVLHKIFFSLIYAAGTFTTFRVELLPAMQHVLESLLIFKLVLVAGTLPGMLGFFVVKDLIYPSRLRYRLQHPHTNWKLSTRIALVAGGSLMAVSGMAIFLLEGERVFQHYPVTDKLFAGFIWAVNTQFGGLENEYLGGFSAATLAILMSLMFAGGTLGSLAGGVKFSTLYLLIKKNTTAKAAVYFLLVLLLQMIIAAALKTENESWRDAVFLQFSAFFNTGWSISELDAAQSTRLILLAFSMFSGRFLMVFVPWILFFRRQEINLV